MAPLVASIGKYASDLFRRPVISDRMADIGHFSVTQALSLFKHRARAPSVESIGTSQSGERPRVDSERKENGGGGRPYFVILKRGTEGLNSSSDTLCMTCVIDSCDLVSNQAGFDTLARYDFWIPGGASSPHRRYITLYRARTRTLSGVITNQLDILDLVFRQWN